MHKWSILEYFFLPSQRVPSLSNQLLIPVISDRQILDELDSYTPTQQYIEELLPVVHDFTTKHRSHFLFLTCDYGKYPWSFGEPRYLEWKEIQAAFNHNGRYLPRNLIEDFGFTKWSEVHEYYSAHEPWFLDEQMRENREELKQAFEQRVSAIRKERS